MRIVSRKASAVTEMSSAVLAADITPPGQPWMSTPFTSRPRRTLFTSSGGRSLELCIVDVEGIEGSSRIARPRGFMKRWKEEKVP